MTAPERVLLVADRDADEALLLAALRRLAPGSPRVTLLVPAYAGAETAPLGREGRLPVPMVDKGAPAADWAAAADRAERCAARMRLAGIELEEAIVGEADALAAAEDAHHARGFDRVAFATPATGAVATAGRA